MREFFVPREMLLYSHEMGTPSDFSVRGFSGGHGEDGSSMTFRIIAAEGIEYWTPAEITTAQWFDPGNSTRRTLSGSLITSLVDVIGGVETISQSTDAYKPGLVTGGLNGYDVATFDGDDRWTGSITPQGTGAFGMFAVWKAETADTVAVAMAGNATANNGIGFGRNQTTSCGYNAFVWAGAEPCVAGSTGSYVMQAALRDATGVSSILNGTKSSTISTSLNLTSTALNVGRSAYPNIYLKGKLAVLVIGALSASDVEKLTGWAAHKYGLTANLPAGHPYKSAPPML